MERQMGDISVIAKLVPVLVIVVAGVLTGLGKLSPDQFVALVLGAGSGFGAGLFTATPGTRPPADPG